MDAYMRRLFLYERGAFLPVIAKTDGPASRNRNKQLKHGVRCLRA